VVSQDVLQHAFGFRLQQGSDRAFRQCGEGRVGRGEDGEGAIAFKRAGQVGGGQCCFKSLEGTRGVGGLEDRCLLDVRSRGCLCGGFIDHRGLGVLALGGKRCGAECHDWKEEEMFHVN